MFDFSRPIDRRGTGSLKWNQPDPAVLCMGTADLDFASAPAIRQALLDLADSGMYGYYAKPEAYYRAVTGWYDRRFGCHIEPQWVLNAPGVWVAARMCIDTYSQPGDCVLVQAPHFSPIARIIDCAGRRMVTNPMVLKDGHYTIGFADFEEKLRQYRPKIYFMVNPHNPTGRAFTAGELQRLVELCDAYGAVLVADEVHSNVLFDGHAHHPILGLGQRAQKIAVLITSASKAYNIMGLTYATVLIADEGLREQFAAAMGGYSMDFATNIFSVAAMTAAYSPACDQWLDELGAYLAGNLDFLCQYIAAHIPALQVIRPESSYLVWIDCRQLGLPPEELRALFLERAKVGLTWGEDYGPEGVGFERINIGCARATLEEALARIERAVKALGAQ